MASPNMNLTIPTPSVTAGPLYAQNISDSLNTIDAHDHTSGKGLKIRTAALNIDADFDINSYQLLGVKDIQFDNESSDPAGNRTTYVKGGELYFKDNSGNAVQITTGGQVAGASGSITGLVAPASAIYTAFNGTFTFDKDLNKRGKLLISDLSLAEFDVANPNIVTFKTASGMTADYSLTLPGSLNSLDHIFQFDSSGVVSTVRFKTGTYAPTITCDQSVTVNSTDFMYYRIGDYVFVKGRADISLNAGAGTYNFDVTLPIASNFTDVDDLQGTQRNMVSTGDRKGSFTMYGMTADTTNDTAEFYDSVGASATFYYYFDFKYEVK